MVQLSFKPRRGQQSLLAACTTSRPPLATATHLSRRADRDRVIGFGDVAAMPDPEWATAERPGRFTVAGLVPGGQLATVPLHNPAEETQPTGALIDDAAQAMRDRDAAFEETFAEDRVLSSERRAGLAAAEWVDAAVGTLLTQDAQAIAATVAARPELRHNHALLMALAPVVAMLKEAEPKPEPLADWELELLALPEGNPDPGAERAFADMDATADAVDAWYAEQAKNDSHDARGAIFADLLFDENEA